MNEQITPNPYQNGYYIQNPPKKEETPLTKTMKSHFSFFGSASAVYALFYAFCLYRNTSGITYPFFVAGTLCYFFLSMKKLGVPYKKDSLFYVISILLLGISNCCTMSVPILWMNKLGIFLLSFILMLHTFYFDKKWNFPKYIGAILCTIKDSVVCLVCPVRDTTSFFRRKNLQAKKQEKTEETKETENNKKNYLLYILIGVLISVPILMVMVFLLASADIVFRNLIFDNLLNSLFSLNISFTDIFQVVLLILAVFFFSYALLSSLCKKGISEEITDRRKWEPVIAITFTGMLSAIYLLFSMIQILYLFIGNMKLPEGYTYSSYARQGFFQLLAVCILNLLLVLFCISFFREHIVLKIVLTVISGCTFIMIISSALRMFMYIARYNLTFLRIFVLWSLMVIFLLMAGITIYIYKQNFPLFFYSVAVTTVLYIALSFAHPDYWIANYNLQESHISRLDEYDIIDAQRYLARLSADAAPILLSEQNPYLPMEVEHMKLSAELEKEEECEGENYSYEEYKKVRTNIDIGLRYSGLTSSAQYYYYKKIYLDAGQMNIRTFNFSLYRAKKSAGL